MARLLLLFVAGMIFTAHVSGMYEVSELFLPFKKDSVFRPFLRGSYSFESEISFYGQYIQKRKMVFSYNLLLEILLLISLYSIIPYSTNPLTFTVAR